MNIPERVETANGRDLLSSKSSYVPKKNKIVHVLSTQFLHDSVSNESHEKPNIKLEYNRTKGRMDNADKLVRCTSEFS